MVAVTAGTTGRGQGTNSATAMDKTEFTAVLQEQHGAVLPAGTSGCLGSSEWTAAHQTKAGGRHCVVGKAEASRFQKPYRLINVEWPGPLCHSAIPQQLCIAAPMTASGRTSVDKDGETAASAMVHTTGLP